jgi:hypothetical protein
VTLKVDYLFGALRRALFTSMLVFGTGSTTAAAPLSASRFATITFPIHPNANPYPYDTLMVVWYDMIYDIGN